MKPMLRILLIGTASIVLGLIEPNLNDPTSMFFTGLLCGFICSLYAAIDNNVGDKRQ